eukprot:15470951-Alexandrium_andersonii.AAC.1
MAAFRRAGAATCLRRLRTVSARLPRSRPTPCRSRLSNARWAPRSPHEGARRDKAAIPDRHAGQAAGTSASGEKGALGLRRGGPQGRREAPSEGQATLGVRERVRPTRNGLEVVSQAAPHQARGVHGTVPRRGKERKEDVRERAPLRQRAGAVARAPRPPATARRMATAS